MKLNGLFEATASTSQAEMSQEPEIVNDACHNFIGRVNMYRK